MFLILILLTSCKKKQMQIKELDFYDYIYAKNTRVKGYLVNNSSKNLYDLEKYLYNYTEKILCKDFIQESEEKLDNHNLGSNDKTIEIDFFRVSKEIPWEIKNEYIPPYHLGKEILQIGLEGLFTVLIRIKYAITMFVLVQIHYLNMDK